METTWKRHQSVTRRSTKDVTHHIHSKTFRKTLFFRFKICCVRAFVTAGNGKLKSTPSKPFASYLCTPHLQPNPHPSLTHLCTLTLMTQTRTWTSASGYFIKWTIKAAAGCFVLQVLLFCHYFAFVRFMPDWLEVWSELAWLALELTASADIGALALPLIPKYLI